MPCDCAKCDDERTHRTDRSVSFAQSLVAPLEVSSNAESRGYYALNSGSFVRIVGFFVWF